MTPFWAGLLLGVVICAAIAAGVGAVAFRRFADLQRRAREAERLAELGTLTGGLAHEIKNPLSTVQLNLQLLAEDIPPDDPAAARLASRLKTVTAETARLREILEDFLRYAGRMELNRAAVDLNGLVEELADFFFPQAQLQRVQLRFDRSPEPVVAGVDEKLVKQAVLNLMLNAVQAMPTGGELILSVGRAGGQWAVVSVTDTGPGIPPEAVERIFDAYYSTKKGGTGLGLAMTRRIVHEHGGKIEVNSAVGRGTQFSMRFPLAAAPAGAGP